MKAIKMVPAIAGLAVAMLAQTPAFAVEHTVVKMYLNSGDAGKKQITGANPTDIDSAAIECPDATCTLALSALQTAESAVGSGDWAIAVKVDGKPVDPGPGFFWQGRLPIADYVTGNWQGKYEVKKGPHTVTFSIIGQVPFILNEWSDTVIVTTP